MQLGKDMHISYFHEAGLSEACLVGLGLILRNFCSRQSQEQRLVYLCRLNNPHTQPSQSTGLVCTHCAVCGVACVCSGLCFVWF